jgi:Restriction endonuclease
MTRKPTKTINRIHFTDLEATRFEDLCLAIIFPLHPWIDIRHYGRTGSDGGVDISATERLEDGSDRSWFVQCRRYARASKSTLVGAVDDALSNAEDPPAVLLVVLACDVRRTAHEAYEKYASRKGVATPLLWTASIIEAKLYAERKDLLFTYFGISQARESRVLEKSVTRNISIKRRLFRELMKEPGKIDWEKARKEPPEKFHHSELIVHSVDDDTYPDVDINPGRVSGWFKIEIWDFYYNGLFVVGNIVHGKTLPDGHWTVVPVRHQLAEAQDNDLKLFELLRIPFRNIVEIDTIGDEFYPQPHIYCRYADKGLPYEGFLYVRADTDYPRTMEPELEVSWEEYQKRRTV